MTDSTYPRKHGRLESFLQKLLAAEASCVTWYEPCIINGGPAKKPSYCFVVLTDENIYLIDNPPKQVRAIVGLREILDVQVVHESPMFLKGEDRENAQNIKITCKFSSNDSSENILRSLSRFSTIPFKSTSRPSSVLSDSSTVPSDGSPTKESERKHRRLRKFLMSLSWPKKKTLVHRFGNGLESMNPSQNFSETSSITSSISHAERSQMSFSRLLPYMQQASDPSPMPNAVLGSFLSKSQSSLPQTMSSFMNGNTSQDWITSVRNCDTDMKDSPADSSSIDSSSNSVMSDLTVRSEPIGRSRTVLGNYADHQPRPSSAILRSMSDTTDNESASLNESAHTTYNEELNLYILKPTSGFFRHLKATWTNFLLKQTLCLDESAVKSYRNDSVEHIERLFRELHRKLHTNSDNNFVLIRQLSDRIDKDTVANPIAKKIFWKDPQMFPALVNKLNSLTFTSSNSEQHTIGYTMDRIKACSSLVHILASMLQKSVYCVGRLKHLTYRNGQRTKDLLKILVNMPWIPPTYRDLTMLTVTSYDHFSSREWENLMEASLIRSLAELTNFSTMALYQYFQLAFEGNELMNYEYMYGSGWMVRIISEVSSVDTFLSRLMCQLLLLTSATDHCPLTPAQAVLLHQQVSILSTIVTSSPQLALQITIMFGEDIRYFVLRRVLEKKILPHYPIRCNLLNSIEILRETILQKQATLSTATRLISIDSSLWFNK